MPVAGCWQAGRRGGGRWGREERLGRGGRVRQRVNRVRKVGLGWAWSLGVKVWPRTGKTRPHFTCV